LNVVNNMQIQTQLELEAEITKYWWNLFRN
jgi:hypothetical protein